MRGLLERCISLQQLKPRKMRFFFKKYLQFELSHGCIEQAERIKELANQYVQSIIDKNQADEHPEQLEEEQPEQVPGETSD